MLFIGVSCLIAFKVGAVLWCAADQKSLDITAEDVLASASSTAVFEVRANFTEKALEVFSSKSCFGKQYPLFCEWVIKKMESFVTEMGMSTAMMREKTFMNVASVTLPQPEGKARRRLSGSGRTGIGACSIGSDFVIGGRILTSMLVHDAEEFKGPERIENEAVILSPSAVADAQKRLAMSRLCTSYLLQSGQASVTQLHDR